MVYIHIRDAEKQEASYMYLREGSGDEVRIVKDLLENGYDGGMSIEPYMGAVFHDNGTSAVQGNVLIYRIRAKDDGDH